MVKLFRWVAACVVLAAFSPLANAQLQVIIERGQENPVPIAVVPFGWQGAAAAPFDIAQVVGADLQSTGRFAAFPRERMIDRPSTRDEIRFQDWRLYKNDFIAIGRVVPEGSDRYRIDYGLYNVLNGQTLLEKAVTTNAASWRRAAHMVADQIFEQLTGIRGAFATRIAYVKVDGTPPSQTYKLIIADTDGENVSEIAKSTEPLMSPAWSPDGQSIAYVSFENKASAIYVQTVRTGERRRVSARAGINGAPAWSPDGSTLALTLSRKDGDVDVYTLQLDSQVLTRMTFDPGIDTEPTWSSDGRKLYFMSDRAGGPQIYEVDVAQPQRATRVTFEGNYNARPRMSPDGKQLAVVYQDRGNFRIAVVDLQTKAVRVLTQGRQDESPSFAPNGAMLIYATQERARGVLALASTDGGISGVIPERSGGAVREPVWSPFPSSNR